MPKNKLKKKIRKLVAKKLKNRPRKRNPNRLKAFVDSSLFKAGFDYNAPIATRARMAPSTMRIRQSRGGNGPAGVGTLTITGRDLIQTVKCLTTSATGDVLCDLKCNPSSLPAARLNVLASMYERYDINRMVFAFEGAVPTTQNGSVLGYMDYDILEVPPTTGGGLPLLQRASAHAGAHPCHVWDGSTWSYAPDRQMTDLYCDMAAYEPRLTTPAHFILLVNDMPTLSSTLDLGKIYVEYSITFHYPKVAEAKSSGSNLWAAEFNNTVGTGIATGTGFFGTTVAAAAYSSIGLSSLMIATDPEGVSAMSIQVPQGHYTATTYWTGGQSYGEGAYDIVPGSGGDLTPTDYSVCTLPGPKDMDHPAYFVGTPLTIHLVSGQTKGCQLVEFRVLSSYTHLFFRWGATVPANSASLSVRIQRVPEYPSLGSDMYIDYVRMLSQFRSFTARHQAELLGAGVAILDDHKDEVVKTPQPPVTEAAGAAAAATSPNPRFRH